MLDHFTIESAIHFLTALAAFVTIVLLWNFRKSPEVKYMIYAQVFVAVWAVTYALEFASTALEAKIFWSKMSYFGIAFLPVSYFLFATAYSQKKNIITIRNIVLLLIIPVITLGMILTNDLHWLVWSAVSYDPSMNMAYYHHGPWFWVYFGYAEIMLFTGLYNLYNSLYRFPAYYKTQISTLILATVFPLVGNFIYVTNLNPYPGFDWTPVSFVISGMIIAISVVRYRMFDIVPIARARLFEVLGDGVIVINDEDYIEDCNHAAYQIFSWQKRSLIHEQATQVFADYPALIHGLKTRNEVVEIEIANNGEQHFYQIKLSPVYRDGKLSGNILLFHNITSIRNAREELKNTNTRLVSEIEKREKLIEDLDAFAHTVAHDLRNSLSSIFSASEIMEDIIRQNDKTLMFELSSMINQSANKSIQITHDLLMLATADKTRVELKPLDMKAIFNDAQHQLTELVKNSGALIRKPEVWPVAFGYAPWIEEVWTNYLSNAIKYGGVPPVIEVGATENDGVNITFWIKDNGNGLTPDEQSRLFRKFVRLNPAKADGYGLGLTIVKKIVEKLGGEVAVESEGDNKGSKFSFTLPSAKIKTETAFRKLHESSGFAVN